MTDRSNTSRSFERGSRKALRTFVQMATSGALTAAVTVLAGGLSPAHQTLVAAGWMFLVTLLQNGLETAGVIPVLLPTGGVVPVVTGVVDPILAPVAGTVDVVADVTGNVAGEVVDTAGAVIGTVGGVVGGVAGGVGGLLGTDEPTLYDQANDPDWVDGHATPIQAA